MLAVRDFDYFFYARETSGGLSSTEWQIEPAAETAGEEAAQEVWAFARVHADMLERLFDGLADGCGAPAMSDAPCWTGFSQDFRYALTRTGRRRIGPRLSALFGGDRAHGRGQFTMERSLEARIDLWMKRSTVEARDAGGVSLTLKHCLGHAVNCCLLRHLRACGGLSVDPEPAARMDRLEALLALVDDCWVPTASDAIIQSGRTFQGFDTRQS